MFLVLCRDFVDGRATKNRLTALQPHLAYIETILDKIVVAGPLCDDLGDDFGGDVGDDLGADVGNGVGGAITGSLLIYNVDSESAARGLLEADPYYHADIWELIEIRRFRPVAGEWVGGKNW